MSYGPSLYTHSPATPETTLPGVVDVLIQKEEKAYRIPAAGGLQNIHPHPPSLKNAVWQEMGGGGYHFFLGHVT